MYEIVFDLCRSIHHYIYQKNRDESISFIFYGMNDLKAKKNLGFWKTLMWNITYSINLSVNQIVHLHLL